MAAEAASLWATLAPVVVGGGIGVAGSVVGVFGTLGLIDIQDFQGG